jgi:methionyl-tRNA formyltransferase
MKIVFLGTAELSCASLDSLVRDKNYTVAAVVTQPDKPKGRELKLQPSPVKALAIKHGLPVLQPARARDEQFIAQLRALQPELLVVIAYGHILPVAILDLPLHGCLNIHTSLLPAYRGAAPIQWAIANGETITGVTIMKMDAGLDTGPILAQRDTPILPEDDSAKLHDRLAQIGAELLLHTIPDYAAGKVKPVPQPSIGISHAPKIKKEDGHIDWNLPAKTIWNRMRAFTPWPGAFTHMPVKPRVGRGDGESGSVAMKPHLLKIWKAEVIEENPVFKPGEIISADRCGIIVACGKNALRILELQREGGRRMGAGEFLAGNPLNRNDTFVGQGVA